MSRRAGWRGLLGVGLALLLCAPSFAGGGSSSGDPHGEEHTEEHGEEHSEEHSGEHGHGDGHGGHSSALSDVPKPLDIGGMPQRPKPLVELGEPFLGTGTLDPGFQLPTGAVWQPSMLVFGTLRTSLQSFEPDSVAAGSGRITELSARLDLFLNLSLSGSERLVAGIRALDGNGRFTSYFIDHPDPALDGEFREEIDADLEVLFFEGDFGEIFPDIDRDDFGTLDYGFSVGRQPLLFQEGLLIDDTIDGIGITRNTLLPGNSPNFRTTFFYGWDNLNTSFGAERDAQIFALLTSTDTPKTTLDIDVAYVDSNDLSGSLVAAGVSAVQRLGGVNTSFRLLGSWATDDPIPGVDTSLTAADGYLAFSEVSWVPHGTHDLVYLNNFWAVDRYTPAARGAGGLNAGPLGRAGISFASVGLGSFDAPLSSQAHDVAGGAIGYQRFLDHTRKQLLFEVGYRVGTENTTPDAYAGIVRYQAAAGQHLVWVVDAFAGYREIFGGPSQNPWGGRLELVVKF
ncbi:MAG: hypothetical protein AAGE94_21110 [Acidobacteriota bacterium]